MNKRLSCLAIPALLVILAIYIWIRFIGAATISVELLDGQIRLRPESVRAGSRPIRFDVQNMASTPHQFLVIAVDKPAGEIPVQDGVAQFFSEPGKETTIHYDGQANGGYSMMGPQPNPSLGPPMEPGERRQVQMGYPVEGFGEATLTILCNLPGHYERGENAILEVEE